MKRFLFFALIGLMGCTMLVGTFETKDASRQLDYSTSKVMTSLDKVKVNDGFPRSVKKGDKHWSTTGMSGWTSGFYPGLLWYLYEYSGNEELRSAAENFSNQLEPLRALSWNTHDLGFMMYCSVGNGYRLTGNPQYKEWLLQTADSLATLYNPNVGTLLSWPWMKEKNGWPHNTIIDNMLNLELLFWAAKNGGDSGYYHIAVKHALTTLQNHFRPDYSTYHVLVYDTRDGKVLQRITDQGYADESVWARGQAWAIYGFAMCYRETGMEEFREAAMGAADYYLNNLPDDYIPYWDFNLPDLKEEEKDVSAAAITASGLMDLVNHLEEESIKAKYLEAVEKTLRSLSSEEYQSSTMAILDHSVGSKPHKSEVDVPIIYADYYYVEALLRYLNRDGNSS